VKTAPPACDRAPHPGQHHAAPADQPPRTASKRPHRVSAVAPGRPGTPDRCDKQRPAAGVVEVQPMGLNHRLAGHQRRSTQIRASRKQRHAPAANRPGHRNAGSLQAPPRRNTAPRKVLPHIALNSRAGSSSRSGSPAGPPPGPEPGRSGADRGYAKHHGRANRHKGHRGHPWKLKEVSRRDRH